ncbi:Motility protein B [compost metagenome]
MERERLELLLQELQNKVEENPQLQRFKDQILFEITQDGLRIQIMDAESRPMFDSGSARLQPHFEDILLALADTIRAVPNKISISGHTDAKPFAGAGEFGNWELSANRANAARRALIAGGYDEAQVARVVGYASSALFDRDDPLNPVNRRIDIVVLTKKAQRAIEGEQDGAVDTEAEEPDGATVPDVPQPPVADPAGPDELRERLNIFEDGVLQLDQSSE